MSKIKREFEKLLLKRMAQFPSNRQPVEKHSLTRLTATGRGNCGTEYRIVVNRRTGSLLEDYVSDRPVHSAREPIQLRFDDPLLYLYNIER